MSNEVRELSRRLFKARYRLEVGAEIAERLRRGEPFCNKELALALGDPPGKNGISGELKVLKESGLVQPDRPADRTAYLRATPSPYWDMCLRLRDDASTHLADAW